MLDDESAPMSGQTVEDGVSASPTFMTVEDLVSAVSDAVSDSVVVPLSARMDALEGRFDVVAGRSQLDGLSERVDALSGMAATKQDLQAVSASFSADLEQASLQAGELGPVLDDDVGTVIISLVGDLLELLDSDSDGASDVASAVSEIRTCVQDISGVLVHPAMSTDFADYTVLEAILLLSLLFALFKFWFSMLEGGFSWLR